MRAGPSAGASTSAAPAAADQADSDDDDLVMLADAEDAADDVEVVGKRTATAEAAEMRLPDGATAGMGADGRTTGAPDEAAEASSADGTAAEPAAVAGQPSAKRKRAEGGEWDDDAKRQALASNGAAGDPLLQV